MNQTILGLSLIGTVACGLLTGAVGVRSQIIPDNTLPVDSRVAPGCTRCTIDGGTVRGVNLYHSFREFSVPTGGEAFFNNGLQIQNILTRVTGSSISNIDGLIRANGTASLFFLNPNGILFGPNTRLQVGGSFVASTASSFKFSDGSEFSATRPQAPPLLTINITPGLQMGAIAPGSTIVNQGNLIAGQDLMLESDRLDLQGQLWAGRNLTLQAQDSMKIRDSATAPFIAMAGGDLLVQGNRSVDIFALNHPVSELVSGGTMLFKSANPVNGDAHYWSAGTFRIEQLNGELGTLVSLYDPIIRSQGDVTFQDYRGTSLHILAGGRVTAGAIVITGNDTIANTINPTATPTLATVPLSNGSQVVIDGSARPTVDIRAGMDPSEIGTPLGTSGYNPPFLFGFGSLLLVGQNSFIFPQSSPPPNNPTITGSDIEINVISVDQPNGQVLLTNQFRPNRSLPDGSITVNSNSVLGYSGIYTDSRVGNGGDVTLDARGTIRLNGDIVTSSISSPGNGGSVTLGNGGSVTLLAGGDITLAPNNSVYSEGLLGGSITLRSGGTLSLQGGFIQSASNTSGLRAGGDVNVTVRSLILRDGASLGAETSGGAASGNLTVNALEKVQLVGAGPRDGSALFSVTRGNGKGGDVTITTPELFLSNGGQVAVNTLGAGAGGNLTIRTTKLIDITGRTPSGRSASSLGTNTEGDGNAGIMTIETDQLRLLNGAQIGAGTFKAGNGGKVNITASDIRISGRDTGLYTTANQDSTGNAGDVEIRTDLLLVEDNGDLTANTTSQGRGGAITITANQLMVQSGGEISARTLSRGTGGQITINAKNTVEVKGRSRISTASLPDATGSAGGLSITTNRLTLLEGGQIDSSSFGIGRGGDVFVTADSIEASGLSISGQSASGLFVSANSQLANAGSGGSLKINTRQLLIRDSAQFSAGTFGGGEGGSLEINASESIRIEGGNPEIFSGIFSAAASTGNAGDIQISTPLLALQGKSTLDAGTAGEGHAGSIVVSTSTLTLSDGASVATNTSSSGRAGNITLKIRDRVTLTDPGTSLKADTTANSTGDGGNITVTANSFDALQGGQLATTTGGTGKAGNITLTIRDRLNLADPDTGLFADTALGSSGAGGSIDITTGAFSLSNGAQLRASTSGQGDAGNVSVRNAQTVSLFTNSSISTAANEGAAGQGGNVTIQAGLLTVDGNARISASTATPKRAGDVEITANDFAASKGGQIQTTTSNSGKAGNITLKVNNRVTLTAPGTSLSANTTANSTGDGGNISVTANSFEASRGGQLLTTTGGTGKAGDITLQVRDRVSLADSGTAILANTAKGSSGQGGNIIIDPELVEVKRGARIAVDSEGTGQGGNLSITAKNLTLDQGSITATTASANGGNITLDVKDLILLRRNGLISATAGTTQSGGDGGNINIQARFIIGVLGENSDITANAFTGRGGNINITTNAIFGLLPQPQLTPLSDITASSQFGLNGTVTINSLNVDPSKGLEELGFTPVDPSKLVVQGCNSGRKVVEGQSRFVVLGRGGLSASPDDVFGGTPVLTDLGSPIASSAMTDPAPAAPAVSAPTEIVEAQGWVKGANGEIYLVNYASNPPLNGTQLFPVQCQGL